VTEKFFKILGQDLVPIVYGGADYTQHAPAHSYIDALKYKPKELAAYLQLLITNCSSPTKRSTTNISGGRIITESNSL
jgi:hypothetical protein